MKNVDYPYSLIGSHGHLEVPDCLDHVERLELLDVVMGHALGTKQPKRRYKLVGLQKKIEQTKEIIDLEKATNSYQKFEEEEMYRQAKTAASNIVHMIFNLESSPK